MLAPTEKGRLPSFHGSMFGGEGRVAASGGMVETAGGESLAHGSKERQVVLDLNHVHIAKESREGPGTTAGLG